MHSFVNLTPAAAYLRCKETWPYPQPEAFAVLVCSAQHAFYFARYIVKGPLLEGESAIATEGEYALQYARDILRAPFLLGEQAIARNAAYALAYAETVLNGPFPSAEPIISQHPQLSLRYASKVLGRRFPLGELSVATHSESSYYYARHVMEGQFSLGEPTIYQDPQFCTPYLQWLDTLETVEPFVHVAFFIRATAEEYWSDERAHVHATRTGLSMDQIRLSRLFHHPESTLQETVALLRGATIALNHNADNPDFGNFSAPG